jgi:hypothetical protein
MRYLNLLLGLPLLVAVSPRAAAATVLQDVGPAAAQDTSASIFGEPLVINGQRVSDEKIKLQLIYGPGRMMVDLYKVGVIIQDEISRQAQELAAAEVAAQEAAKPYASAEERAAALQKAIASQTALLTEKYRIKDEAFEEEYQYTIDTFAKDYPVLDIGAEISRAFRSVEWYREQLRQTMYFDSVFLPVNPENWPSTTLEAMRNDPGGGALLIDDAKQSYESRLKASEKNGGKLPREDSLYMTLVRQIVRDAMFSVMTFKTPADGLPAGIAFQADTNGDGKPEVELSIEQLWKIVEPTVNPTEIHEAKQWFVTAMATRDRLLAEGALLTDADARQSIQDLASGFEGALVTLEQSATGTYFFPSVQNFVEYYTMREGFRKLVEPKLANGPAGELSTTLREYYERANRVMGLGMIDCEVLLVSAMDIPRFRWKSDGWAKAKAKAADLRKQLDQNVQDFNAQRAARAEATAQGKEYKPDRDVPDPYRFWSQMVDDHSEYWDPPPPEGPGKRQSDVAYKKKGRFGPKYRNDLIGFVGETPFSEWVSGECITDRMFFDQMESSVAGPFRGPLGYYITRVNRRTPPSRPLNLSDPKHVALLRDDYLRWAFIQYSKEAVAKATITGFRAD